MVLMKMKKIAETYVGKTITEAVITVPAFFNQSQRQATKDAAVISGFNVLELLNETTAAAIAYARYQKIDVEKNILVFHLGGGTFDVSILTIEEGNFEVQSTSGDTHLGGEDFDNRMVTHFIQEFKREHKKVKQDISGNKRAVMRLRTACEEAKRTLSSSSQASVKIDSLHEGIDFYTSITRAKFEELCSDLFRRILDRVKKSLRDAEMDRAAIHEIISVGGSTRIPKVQELLQDFFNVGGLKKSIYPDEAVAHGAALCAARYADESLNDVDVLDNCHPYTITADVKGYGFEEIFETSFTISDKVKTYSATREQQKNLSIKIYEDAGPMQQETVIGNYNLKGFYASKKGSPFVQVCYSFDSSGIFNLTADNLTPSVVYPEWNNALDQTNYEKKFCDDDILNMARDTQNLYAEYEKQNRIRAKNKLEIDFRLFLSVIKCASLMDKISESDEEFVLDKCNEIVKWMDKNQFAEKEEFEHKKKELEKVCMPIVTKLFPEIGAGGFSGGAFPGGAFPGGAGAGGTETARFSLNCLEIYLHFFQSVIKMDQYNEISEYKEKVVLKKCDEIVKWIDQNQLAEKEEFEHKLKELEKVCIPIVIELLEGDEAGGFLGGAGFPGGAGGFPGAGGAAGAGKGPTIEEVD